MHGICHAEVSLSGQVWRVNDTDCDFKALIRFNFSNSEHYMPAKKNKRNHYIPPLAVFTDRMFMFGIRISRNPS